MEKSRLNFLVMFAALSLLAISCKRSGSESSKSADTRIQPGGTSEESEDSGYLALKILKVHEGREPLDRAPWHGPGGDWTFVECEPIKARGLRVVIGARTQKEESRGEFSFGWGRGMLALANSTDAPRLVEVFAKAFHQKLPPSHGHTPAGLLKVNTAVLGANLVRDPEGGFKSGRGKWTATKWFLEDENTGEAEVFFNYNLSEKRAEFSEKDEDYREPLIELLTVALRDGPLPERTPENDPNLTLAGPRVSAWTRIADKNANCRFTPDSRSIVVTETSTNGASQLFLVSAAGGSERQSLAKFDGAAAVQEFVNSGEKLLLFVTETLRRKAKTFSSADPQHLWFVAENQKRELPVRADLTNWHVTSKCVSPDANFVALHAWITQPNEKRARVIYMANVRSSEWRTIEKPNTALQLVGWTNGNGVVLTGAGFDKGESRNAYTLNPVTGQLTPLDSLPAAFNKTNLLSPNARLTAWLQEKECIVITDLATKQIRRYAFHPYDRRHAYSDSIAWGSDRYLVFHGLRTALIDIESLKMNYPAAKESGFTSVEFSPDFKAALGTKEDGCYLGRVELPETAVVLASPN